MKTQEELMKQAIATWGWDSELDMVVEECAELIDAIQKYRRRRIASEKVLEEAVDVSLVCELLKLMLNSPELWTRMQELKLTRLSERLESECERIRREG